MKCLWHKNEIRPFKDKYAPRNLGEHFMLFITFHDGLPSFQSTNSVGRISLHNAQRYALPRHLFHYKRLKDIAFLDVVKLIKSYTALVALRYLARIVLESLKR